MKFAKNAIWLLALLFVAACQLPSTKHEGTSDFHTCTEMKIPTTNDLNVSQDANIASLLANQWHQDTLRFKFLDGDPRVQAKVVRIAKTWEQYCGIVFLFGDWDHPDATIGFKQKGSWSYIGTDSRLIARQGKASMNFGWLDQNSNDSEYQRVVLHEFGHALGLIHEHQNPKGGICWKLKEVYQWYKRTQGWSNADTKTNVIDKYSTDQTNGTELDPLSIMMYFIPKGLTCDGFHTKENIVLSEQDKYWVGVVYPKK